MLNRIALLLLIAFTLTAARAQDTTDYATRVLDTKKKDTRSLKDRIWFGGGVGLNFGTFTSIQVEPLVGYKVDQEGKFSVGTGFTYWYFSDNRFTPRAEFNAYGYRFFSRYRVIEQAYLHAEYLNLNAQRYDPLSEGVKRFWVPHLLLGGGYVQPLGANSSFTLQVLWEVLQDPNSVYRGQGPIFGGGVGFGF